MYNKFLTIKIYKFLTIKIYVNLNFDNSFNYNNYYESI